MKRKLLTVISCFILSNAIFAQNEWAPLGAKWYYTLTNSSSSDISFNYLESVKDTSVNNIQCKKLSRLHETCDDRPKLELMFEDNRRVYFYDEFTSMFTLLYDFNKLPDEEWYIRVNNGWNIDSLLVHVDSVSSVYINEHILKVLHTTIGNNSNWIGFSGKITEKLGHEKNMFPFLSRICDINFIQGIRCYEDSILGLFQTGMASSCDFSSVDIDEFPLPEKYAIFPNPVTNELFFNNIDNTTISITIYNIYGSIIQTLKTNDNKINISNLKNDVYLIMVKNLNNEILLINKIIKY